MKLFNIKQTVKQWLKRGRPQAELANDNSSEDLHARRAKQNATSEKGSVGCTELSINIDPRPDPTQQRGLRPKVLEWRRRVLVRKGARMHASMLQRSDGGSLAMLDAFGIVVCWYEEPGRLRNERFQSAVLSQHVSQFYMPTDVASNVPTAHLKNATSSGSSTEQGWRRRSDGSTYWATTVIEPIALQGGPVQGFSHIVRESKDPMSTQQSSEPAGLPHPERQRTGFDARRVFGVTSAAGVS
jgi:hypothetical protein